jgi:hypothetical protein
MCLPIIAKVVISREAVVLVFSQVHVLQQILHVLAIQELEEMGKIV